ncbi:hypothetical protein B4U80_13027 [Leptotrombidium deliense]|uniref:Uncharacterized protein n=1 Tax=Leptotrombidium deliense TaxID=299467 RepID=A0A443SEJ4_9ACAR|nr:hypothetical protein B4U80_13027 [Leptotrombidium deliense]
MLKALITRKVNALSLSWFRTSIGAQSKFSENNDHEEHKYEDKEQPRSYKPLDGCPHTWFERLSLVTTAFIVGLRTQKGSDTHKRDEHVTPKPHNCRFNKLLTQYIFYAKPGARLSTVLPETGSGKIRINESEPSTSTGATTTSRVESLIESLEATANEYTNELNNVIAMALLENGETMQAIKLLHSCQSSAKAMFNLGLIFQMGKHDLCSREPDYEQAMTYYEIASNLGHKDATYNMGMNRTLHV